MKVSAQQELKMGETLDKYKEIFGEQLGSMKHFKAKLSVKPDAKPNFFKPHPVPFAIKEQAVVK